MHDQMTTGRKVVRNAGWIIAGKVFHMLLTFFIGLLSARYLGPSNYGLINYAALYITFFTALCTLGINSVIVKDFVDHPQEEGVTVGTTLVLRAASSLLSAVMIVGLVCIVDAGETLTIVVVALCSLSLLFQVFDTINYWFQARLQSKFSAIATSISYTVVSAYKVILLICRMDVRWFALATSLDYIVAAVVLLIAYRKNGGPRLVFFWEKGKQLLAGSKSFILCGMMVAIYNCTDRFMLKHMLSEAAVGYYAVATSICSMWVFVLSAIIDSMYPSIMQAHLESAAVYEKRNRQLYAIVFYLSVLVSAVITAAAGLIVRILYGEAYLPAVGPLQIITWYTAFSYLGVARNAWMVCENKQKYLTPIYIGAAATNVLLNALMIPAWGASGAAAASLITQITTIFVFPSLVRGLRPNAKMMLDAILLKNVLPTRRTKKNEAML